MSQLPRMLIVCCLLSSPLLGFHVDLVSGSVETIVGVKIFSGQYS